MTFNDRNNLAQDRPGPRRRSGAPGPRRRGGDATTCALAVACLLGVTVAPAAPLGGDAVVPPVATPHEDVPPPQMRPPEIPPQILQTEPAAGRGRLALMIWGNRRWCTYPDDRVVRPPQPPGTFQRRTEVYTFGYQFSVAAVKRGQADEPVMLYTSPIYSTASWIAASKIGKGQKKAAPGRPTMAPEVDPTPKSKQKPTGPDTPVPMWHEQYRCVTMPERMDFDLDPGTYDVYMAFDVLSRDNSWVHRSVGYLTEIPIEAARRTRLDGTVNLAGGSERQVELLNSVIEPEAPASPAKPGP
jgi:hypothetical protein